MYLLVREQNALSQDDSQLTQLTRFDIGDLVEKLDHNRENKLTAVYRVDTRHAVNKK